LDDILALARPFGLKHQRFAADWITELAQLVKVQMDWSSEAADKDSLIRNEKLHVCFTILYHLGFHGEYCPRSFSSKFAMLALNIRNCDILISVASYTPANLKYTLNPMDEPGQ
jgi:mediator of RNA polymerase II transcription subunit 16